MTTEKNIDAVAVLREALMQMTELAEACDSWESFPDAPIQRARDVLAATDRAATVAKDSDREKLLLIIAYAYQIAGAHDAPDHILDVLCDPEAATEEQIEAMLPYQPETSASTVAKDGGEDIPKCVYYAAESNNFYSMISKQGMGRDFDMEWRECKHLFPQSDWKADATAKRIATPKPEASAATQQAGNIDTSNITSAIICDTDKMKLIFKSKAACEKFRTQLHASIFHGATSGSIGELPPLPAPTRRPYGLHYNAEEMDAYGRACIAADRAARSQPTDMSRRLRDAMEGSESGIVRVTRDLLKRAAEEIERYYGGMVAWKRTAEEKDAEHVAARIPVSVGSTEKDSAAIHNMDLVIARLEQIVATEGEYADNLVDLAKEALPCAIGARASQMEAAPRNAGVDAKVSASKEGLLYLRTRIKEMQEAAYTFGEYSQEAVRVALDGVLDEIDGMNPDSARYEALEDAACLVMAGCGYNWQSIAEAIRALKSAAPDTRDALTDEKGGKA